MTLSIVSPVYNSDTTIRILVDSIIKYASEVSNDFEIILVDDGSIDDSWKEIEETALNHVFIKGIKLSRNFGQHYAISAGLKHAAGEWIIVMDCDLQDNPAEIVALYEKAQQGYHIVTARRIDRKDTFLKKATSIVFWKTLSYLIGVSIDYRVANFGIYHREVINAINSFKDSIRFFPTMVLYTGFKKTTIDVIHSERHAGKSGYSYYSMLKLAINIIVSNSDKPFRILIKIGFSISIISSFIGLYYLVLNLSNHIVISNYTSIIISIWFLGGFCIFIFGIFGLYLGRIYDNTKGRPNFIIEKKTN